MQLVLVISTSKINFLKYNDKRKIKFLENFVSQHPWFVLQSNKVCVREERERDKPFPNKWKPNTKISKVNAWAARFTSEERYTTNKEYTLDHRLSFIENVSQSTQSIVKLSSVYRQHCIIIMYPYLDPIQTLP